MEFSFPSLTASARPGDGSDLCHFRTVRHRIIWWMVSSILYASTLCLCPGYIMEQWVLLCAAGLCMEEVKAELPAFDRMPLRIQTRHMIHAASPFAASFRSPLLRVYRRTFEFMYAMG